MTLSSYLGAALVSGLVVVTATAASAQTQQLQQAPTREEIRREGLSPDSEAAPQAAAIEGGVERAPCPLAQPRFGDVRFVLRGVEFDNLVGLSSDQFVPDYADYIGQDVPIAVVCDIRDRAATRLRNAGYLAAVQVPPQRIEGDGIVHLEVLAAHISRLQVRGDIGNSEDVLAAYLEPLTEQPVFNQRDAERSLLLAGEIPGYNARLALRPAGGAPGEVIGDVRVEQTKFVLDGNIQNYGSKSAGRFGGQVRAQINDITGLADRTVLGFYATPDFDEQLVLNAAHDFAIGGHGLRFGGEFTYGWNDPTIGNVSPFDTETLVASLRTTYPFILDQATRLDGEFGIDLIDQDIDFGGVALNRDRLRVAFAGVRSTFTNRASLDGSNGYSAAEPRRRFGISGQVRQGLDILNASDAGTRLGRAPQTRLFGDAEATLFRLEAVAELRPTPLLAWVLESRAQLATDPLLAYEEFAGGSFTTGRGYDPGAVLGDNGFGFRSELRYNTIVPQNDKHLAWQPFAFFDAAWVHNKDPVFFGIANNDHIYSTGAGVRFNYGNVARFDVALAVPLVRTNFQTETPDPRLLVSLFVRFAR